MEVGVRTWGSCGKCLSANIPAAEHQKVSLSIDVLSQLLAGPTGLSCLFFSHHPLPHVSTSPYAFTPLHWFMLFPQIGGLFSSFLPSKILVIKLDVYLGDKVMVGKEHYFYFCLAKHEMTAVK